MHMSNEQYEAAVKLVGALISGFREGHQGEVVSNGLRTCIGQATIPAQALGPVMAGLGELVRLWPEVHVGVQGLERDRAFGLITITVARRLTEDEAAAAAAPAGVLQ